MIGCAYSLNQFGYIVLFVLYFSLHLSFEHDLHSIHSHLNQLSSSLIDDSTSLPREGITYDFELCGYLSVYFSLYCVQLNWFSWYDVLTIYSKMYLFCARIFTQSMDRYNNNKYLKQNEKKTDIYKMASNPIDKIPLRGQSK